LHPCTSFAAPHLPCRCCIVLALLLQTRDRRVDSVVRHVGALTDAGQLTQDALEQANFDYMVVDNPTLNSSDTDASSGKKRFRRNPVLHRTLDGDASVSRADSYHLKYRLKGQEAGALPRIPFVKYVSSSASGEGKPVVPTVLSPADAIQLKKTVSAKAVDLENVLASVRGSPLLAEWSFPKTVQYRACAVFRAAPVSELPAAAPSEDGAATVCGRTMSSATDQVRSTHTGRAHTCTCTMHERTLTWMCLLVASPPCVDRLDLRADPDTETCVATDAVQWTQPRRWHRLLQADRSRRCLVILRIAAGARASFAPPLTSLVRREDIGSQRERESRARRVSRVTEG
jgi:hypothetical protein